MIPKKLEDIDENDLILLKENKNPEGKTIEYKRDLTLSRDKEKREFLADVSSFANSSGGDLIFGIVEEGGVPVEIKGLDIDDIDSEILRMSNMIRDGIDPRIPSVNIQSVRLSDDKIVFVIRIGKSWISPHRVTFNGHDKFYTRSSGGKYPMDVSELRNAFLISETITEKVRKFRENRISNIISNETPVLLKEGAKIVLHLIPFCSFNIGQRYDIENLINYLQRKYKDRNLPIIDTRGGLSRYNLDGYLTCDSETGPNSYTQFFKNGIIETVGTGRLRREPSINPLYEDDIIESFLEYSKILEELCPFGKCA
jgi:hypothetical protein